MSRTESGATPEKTEPTVADDFAWVYEVIASITYKPMVQFGFMARESGRLEFTLTAQALDANGSGRLLTFQLNDYLHELDFVFLVHDVDRHHRAMMVFRNLARRWEEHELQEWFRYDGKCVVNPHP